MTVTNQDHQGCFPVPNPTTPFWRTELHGIDSYHSPEGVPAECDVLIIGAGLSGVATAYYLLEGKENPPSIVILEAREVCSGATGRNGGHTKMGYTSMAANGERFGSEMTRQIAAFQAAQVREFKRIVEKEKIDCDFFLTRCLEVIVNQKREAADARRVFNNQFEQGDFRLEDVGFIDGTNTARTTSIKGANAATSVTAASLWPYKFVSQLLASLVSKGVKLRTHTPVTSVSTKPDGTSVAIHAAGSILAQKVVFASNAYTSGLLKQYRDKIIPVKGTCSHIIVPPSVPNPPNHLSHTYGITTAVGRDYLVPRPDGSIIVGGGRQTFARPKELWYNNIDDSTLIKPAEGYFDGYMQRTFLGWENSQAETERVWTGIMGFTTDRLPHIGLVPGKKSQYILAGFNGAGMAHILLSAKGIARMIRDGVGFEETGVPGVFKTSWERLESELDLLNPDAKNLSSGR